jgi:cell division protein FtsN
MAKSRTRKAVQRNGADRQSSSLPGWMYMLAGLAIGLTVAYAIYVNGNKAPPAKPTAEAVSAPPSKPSVSKPAPAVAAEEPIAEGEVTFDFYNMLPNLDVGLGEEQTAPEASAAPAATAAPPAVSKQGIYIIQAGSFSGIADANKRKAELGLLGIRSEIKAGDANGRTVYRVYTAPLTTPNDVNRTSSLLAGAGIEIMLKRVSD